MYLYQSKLSDESKVQDIPLPMGYMLAEKYTFVTNNDYYTKISEQKLFCLDNTLYIFSNLGMYKYDKTQKNWIQIESEYSFGLGVNPNNLKDYSRCTCVFNNKFHVIGVPIEDSSYAYARKYHYTWTESEGWTRLTDLTFEGGDKYCNAIVYNNTIYYATYSYLYKWDIKNDTWITINKPQNSYGYIGVYNDLLYIVGRNAAGVYSYNGATFTYITNVPYEFYTYGVSFFIDYRGIHIIGGTKSTGFRYSMYSFETNKWTQKVDPDNVYNITEFLPSSLGTTLLLDNKHVLYIRTSDYGYKDVNRNRYNQYRLALMETSSKNVQEFCNKYL